MARTFLVWCAVALTIPGLRALAPFDSHALAPFDSHALAQGGQTDRPKMPAAFAEVDRLLRDYATQAHAPGAAWGIIVNGELAHTGTTGFRDVAAQAPVDADTVFRIASMTKSFTAMSILKLRGMM